MGLENSISEMIERQDSLSDKADAAEARHETYMGQTSPGLQPLLGLLPNQAGTDNSGDGLPDGWYLPANGGFTSWELAGSSTNGDPANIIPGSLEEEFYAGIPGNGSANPSYRNFTFNFWRYSWDLTAGGFPDELLVLSESRINRNGTLAAWVKEETPGVLDHLTSHQSFVRGSDGWAVWYGADTAPSGLGTPGHYYHPRLGLDASELPTVGSILICGRQALNARYPISTVGWGFFPGLNRLVDGSDYYHQL